MINTLKESSGVLQDPEGSLHPSGKDTITFNIILVLTLFIPRCGNSTLYGYCAL